MKKPTNAELHDLLQSDAMDRTADYCRRGRAYGTLSAEELLEKFIAAFNAMADQPTDPDRRARESDLSSEFRLRGMEPPYELADQDRYNAAAEEAFARMRTEEPERALETKKRMVEDLERFRAGRKESN
jgi:hypothetical protein